MGIFSGKGVVSEVAGMQFIQTIISEMGRGNFSFLILVVGIAQLATMIRNGRKQSEANKRISPESGEKGESQ